MIWHESQDGTTVERQFHSKQAIDEFRHKLLLKSMGLRVVRSKQKIPVATIPESTFYPPLIAADEAEPK